MRSPSFSLLFALVALVGCGDSNTTTPDAATDVATDVTSDTATDVASDTTADVATDTATDVTADAATDVTADAATDTAADVASDTARDVVSDVSNDASGSCGSATCAATEICVRQRVLGGALQLPDDAGMCPTGRHLEGSMCVADFSYRCATRPACTTADCACLGSLCQSSYMCRGAEATLLTCELLAP